MGPESCGEWPAPGLRHLLPSSARRGAICEARMNRFEELPADVLDDVSSVVGADVTVLDRLPGGVNAGAVRIELGRSRLAVLKVEARAHPDHLAETLRAQRIAEHMRERGYPTPVWLGVGATASHVWRVTDYVDATPVTQLTPAIVEHLMEIVDLQAGKATEPYDHWAYGWRLATGQDYGQDLAPGLTRAVGRLPGYSPDVSKLVERVRLLCATAPPPRDAPDMVHADLNPGNVLVRDGVVVAVVDIGNAGSGTRATDLATLQWYAFEDALDGVRRQIWRRILSTVGWEGAAVVTGTQILVSLEFAIRQRRQDVVTQVIERGHRALDELLELR